MRVIDFEWSWNFTPRGPARQQRRRRRRSPATRQLNHGTAVVGEIGGDRNAIGITGIAPDATVSAAAFSMPTAAAHPPGRRQARPRRHHPARDPPPRPGATRRRPARLHRDRVVARRLRRHPLRHRQGRSSSSRRRATAPRTSTTRSTASGQPASRPTGRNPFNRANRDSGRSWSEPARRRRARTVATTGPDRSRLDFSNFGARRRRPGLGPRGDHRPATATSRAAARPRTQWYTDRFSGTSSASPIVVGALACVQGILRAESRIPLNAGPGPRAPARDRLAADGCARPPGDPADRQSAEPAPAHPAGRPAGLLDRRPVRRHAPAEPDADVVHLQLAGALARRLDGHAHEPADRVDRSSA